MNLIKLSGMVTKIHAGKRGHLYIAEWIEHLHLSHETIGNRMGVSRTTVWRWQKQQHRLTPGKIAALAEAMNLNAVDLFSPPHRPSLDAMLADAPDDLFDRARELIQVLTRKAS